MKKLINTTLFALFIGLFSVQAQAVSMGFEEGVEYKKTPKPESIQPYKKKVVEVFFYGCPHCYKLEPSLKKWEASKPANVGFEQMPAVLNSPNWIFMARVYYTAKELDIIDRFHSAYFDALHRDNRKLYSVDSIAEFASQFGVKNADFVNTFKSFKVDQLVRKARQRTQAFGIEGVPAVIVNGKYITDVPMARSQANLWQVVDHLTHK